jgi:hypothetical protein
MSYLDMIGTRSFDFATGEFSVVFLISMILSQHVKLFIGLNDHSNRLIDLCQQQICCDSNFDRQ